MSLKSNLHETENYRFERKFVVSELSCHEIESLVRLHPAMFSEVYSSRSVNNLYLDSPSMRHYFDHTQGLKDRVKVRIRWYGDLFQNVDYPALEFKFKYGSMGRKTVFPLPPICIDGRLRQDALMKVLKQADLPDTLKFDLMSLEFSLVNRYRRKYFQSMDHRYRITLDTRIECYHIQGHTNTFLHKSIDRVNTVVELKYDSAEDYGADQICQHFPFRLSKNSKYVNGIEGLSLW